MRSWSQPVRAAAAGVLCLLVLLVMMALHAWPLWTGQTITVPVTALKSQDRFRGERLHIGPPGGRIVVGDPAAIASPKDALVVRPLGDWWTHVPSDLRGRRSALMARVVYLQMEPGSGSEYRPFSIGPEPVKDMLNLKGRIRQVEANGTLDIDYGIDSYYMQEQQAARVQAALKGGARVQMQIAVARSGRARIKAVYVGGSAI